MNSSRRGQYVTAKPYRFSQNRQPKETEMKIIANTRNDAPLGPDELEIAPSAGLAQAPRRILKAKASKALRTVSEEAEALQKEIEEKTAALAARRAAAAELQDQFDRLKAERDGLGLAIKRLESSVAWNEGEIARQAESIARSLSSASPNTFEESSLVARLQATNELMPPIIERWEANLKELNTRIADFAEQNGIPLD